MVNYEHKLFMFYPYELKFYQVHEKYELAQHWTGGIVVHPNSSSALNGLLKSTTMHCENQGALMLTMFL